MTMAKVLLRFTSMKCASRFTNLKDWHGPISKCLIASGTKIYWMTASNFQTEPPTTSKTAPLQKPSATAKGLSRKASMNFGIWRRSRCPTPNQLSSEWGKIEIRECAMENATELAKPVTETVSFVSDDHSEIIGDRMHVDPMLFFADQKKPFLLETRNLPMHFGYPKQHKYNINLEIPEGSAIESLPKPISISTGENVGNFSFNILQSGNKIQLTVTQENNATLVSANFYEAMREFYRKMIEKEHEKIVLKKA